MIKKIIPILEEKTKRSPADTVCEFKWNYPIFQMDRGEFRSCCRTPSKTVTEESLQESGIDAFLNGKDIIQSRFDLINGVRHSDCITCWNLEDRGMKSPREPNQFFHFMQREGLLNKNLSYSEQAIEKGLTRVKTNLHKFLRANKPYMLEISLGNTCDMKCMYCNHHYSTQWAAEEIKLGRITQEQYDKEFPKPAPSFEKTFWEWFDKVGRHTIHRINIIGGEPLIIPKFYEYIDLMISKIQEIRPEDRPVEKPTLCIVTNLNTPPNYIKKFLDKLPMITEMFNLDILISMESLGKRAEYIRNGLDWDRFSSNIDQLFSKKDLKFSVGFLMTVSILSIATTKDFVEYATELSRKYNRTVGLKQNIINYPSWQNPMILPSEFSRYVEDAVHYMEQQVDKMPVCEDFSGRYDQYIIFLKKLAESIKNNKENYTADRLKFYQWFQDFDSKRNLNLLETFPEYTEFFERSKRD